MSIIDGLPIYVTRPDADGMIASYSVPIWLSLAALLMVMANVIAWGAVGRATAAKVIL